MKISVKTICRSVILAYAKKELEKYLCRYTSCKITESSDASRCFVLEVNPAFEDYTAKIRHECIDSCDTIFIESGSESGVLQGVYHMLYKMGIHFGIDKETLSSRFDISHFDGREELFKPFVKNRGIRQHINFPMDISSYSINDAKEYIRNIARMNMNCITFHSYTGQWHGYKTEKETILAGNFFYGQRYYIPKYDKEIESAVSNNDLYCIPEVEEISL